LSSYATAAEHCEPSALASLEHKRVKVYHRRGEYARAASHYQIALSTLRDEADGERAKLLVDWSLTAHALEDNKRAQEMASRALALAESAGDKRSLAQVRNILGILERHRGDTAQAHYPLEHSCAIAATLNDPDVRIAALNNLAWVCRDSHEIDRALKLTETALALCESIGDRHRQAALHNNLADLLHTLGKNEESMAHLEKAVKIFSDIGTEAGAIQPEIWKLVEW
jgi:tetratricopeptide (TPR) repeat protein